MSKKKKNKKKEKSMLKFLELGSKNIKILESGKIKFKKNKKIDISGFIETSVNETLISRLEGIPSKEEIIIDGTETYRLESSANCSSITRIVDLIGNISNDVLTIVLPMTKKKALNLEDNETVCWLAKSSTFISAYSKVKKSWEEINDDDNTSFTNVLFIPKLYIFLEKKGKLRKHPITVNLVVVSLPSINKAKDGIEAMDEVEYTNRIINDSIEASIRCGCKSIIVDPYSMPALQKDVHYIARYWYGKIETQRVIENIKNITFNLYFCIFCEVAL